MRKRYVVCGVSERAIYMWIKPIYDNPVFGERAEIVGLLDIDPQRFIRCKDVVPQLKDIPTYLPDDYERMIAETKPDAVFVVSRDCYHAYYTIKSLEHDLDVVTEKPMTTCWEDAIKVRDAEKKSKGKVVCTFNYRYTPRGPMIREMIQEGKIGRVTHVDLNWYIDIRHGSSYFNRWNRMRENSGSLSIHKACHHFDLVTWLIGSPDPKTVHAMGALNHYGPNGPFNPSKKDGRHCSTCTEKENCAYVARWGTRSTRAAVLDDHLVHFGGGKILYSPSIYRPDMCIFDSEINIQDTIIANIGYANGTLFNYSANFSTPYEGYRLAINGTHGRIETEQWGGQGGTSFPHLKESELYIDYYPIFGSRQRLWFKPVDGAHGGGDIGIQEDIFMGVDPKRKFDILATSKDGLRAIAIGDAVYKSIVNGQIIDLSEVMTH